MEQNQQGFHLLMALYLDHSFNQRISVNQKSHWYNPIWYDNVKKAFCTLLVKKPVSICRAFWDLSALIFWWLYMWIIRNPFIFGPLVGGDRKDLWEKHYEAIGTGSGCSFLGISFITDLSCFEFFTFGLQYLILKWSFIKYPRYDYCRASWQKSWRGRQRMDAP